MTNEQIVLLRLMRSAVTNADVDLSDIQKIDWHEVMREAKDQTVIAMAVDAAESVKEQIPEDVYHSWKEKAFRYLVKNAKVNQSQKHLVKLLEDNGFDYVIIKGEAVASFYPRPELRILGDVDFLIDHTKKEDITWLLRDNGYQSKHESDSSHECHVVFKKPDAHLEMHYQIPGIPYRAIGDKIRKFADGAVKKPERQNGENGEFNVPEKQIHGLILLLHTQHHMVGEGIGLRHLCDWACFVDRTANEPFWKDSLLKFFEEIGLLTYASIITKTCSKAFGIECPDWAVAADDTTCDEVLEDVFFGGNFGTKDSNRVRTGMLITARGKDGFGHSKWQRMCQVLKRNIEFTHPIVKKYRILYPIFFVYRVIKYLVLSLFGKRPTINKLAKSIDNRKSVYEKLHIFEV